jgi:nucleoside-diphosphate-sugar epimerase
MATSKIFITGATGFIGSHAADVALKAGHPVRLSIRKAGQQPRLEKVFAPYIAQLEFVVVPDIMDVDSLRDALVGIDYVWHIASPMPGTGIDVKTDYVDPAVRGTTAVLEAARTHKTIKKVVIMSSLLSLAPLGSLGAVQSVVSGMYPHQYFEIFGKITF